MPAACSAATARADFGDAAGREARIGDEEGDRVVAPVVGEPEARQVRAPRSTRAIGISSTVVTPRRVRCAIAAGCASPAKVPRSASGTPGCEPREAAHVQLVDDRRRPRHARTMSRRQRGSAA